MATPCPFPGGCAVEGYAIGALWDPQLLSAETADTARIRLNPAAFLNEERPDGLELSGLIPSSKESIQLPPGSSGRQLHLPRAMQFVHLSPDDSWEAVGRVGQWPLAVYREGEAVFSLDPTLLVQHHLNMMDTGIAADIIDLVVRCILGAMGRSAVAESQDLRRDFHALGVACWMVEQLAAEMRKPFDDAPVRESARRAALCLHENDLEAARAGLQDAFDQLAAARARLLPLDIYLMDILHGGILIGDEGFGEFDWPQAAADLLDFYLGWNERFAYRYSHDIGAGTLHNLSRHFPETIQRLRKAWHQGEVEFVNGTWSQPFLHLWSEEDARQQFVHGLAVFDELFGRRPATYAAQEFALHPALPGLLREYGYEWVIHRIQNRGDAPLDDRPLIDWVGTDGSAIPALPSHSPRSEKLGSAVYREWPRLAARTAEAGLPFFACVNLMDQSSIGPYKEEFVRAGRYADVLGRFVTCQDFFERTAHMPRERVQYSFDDYAFELELAIENRHRYESGGLSTTIEYWRGESEALKGRSDEVDEWRRVLDGESHDAYIVSRFKTGAFMERALTDYEGPRYVADSNGPYGVTRCMQDAVGFPAEVRARVPVPMTGDGEVTVDPDTGGAVIGQNVFGALVSTRARTHVVDVKPGDVSRVAVEIEETGRFELSYWTHSGHVYGLAERMGDPPEFRFDVPYWEDCIYLRHRHGQPDAVVQRRYANVMEATTHGEFYSYERVLVGAIEFLHGGNGFLRVGDGELHNRLWCHNETARSFWWAVTV